LKNIFLEYFKHVELAIVIVIRSVADEHTFSTLTFMKSKSRNGLTINMDLVARMYAQDFFNLQAFPFHATNTN
jgi:hypothetical protein